METILVVDDDSGFRTLVTTILGEGGYQIEEAASVQEARQAIQKKQYDLVISDLRLPDGNGIQVLDYATQISPETPVIMITAFATLENAVEAMKRGALDYLRKPLSSPDELQLLVHRTLQQSRIVRDREQLREELHSPFSWGAFITEDPRTLQVLKMAKRVAPTESTVLILGESGTGKEVLARCIHQASPRADGPFVAVNCAALSPTLIESELFGHEKGAFTGAISRHVGRFERARGGTLFLDEIGELSIELQAKLLRVLQEKTFERVGGSQAIAADARIISASNKDLKQKVQQESFREDLFFRLSTFPLSIPPLRARPLDIAPLTAHLLARSGRGGDLRLSEAALDVLKGYDWPGNVRELQNVIERAAILCDGTIFPEHLPFGPEVSAPPVTLADMERRAIENSLRENQGNRAKTAAQLGISARTLQYRLKEYGLTEK